jgi:hypothetical protein
LVATIHAAAPLNHVSALYPGCIVSARHLYWPNSLMQIDKRRPSGILEADRDAPRIPPRNENGSNNLV